MSYTVKLNDVDISNYVQGNSFDFVRARNDFGQVLINPVPTMVGIDVEGFWNPLNPASVFYGINDLSEFDVQILDEETLVFDGFIQNITRQGDGLANVELQTELQRLLNQNIIYSTGGIDKNPGELFIEVCNLYNIDYDTFSVNASRSIYEADEVRVQANVLTPYTTILSFFEQLAQIGIASIYSIGNKLYYQVYDTTEKLPVIEFVNTYDQNQFYIQSKPIIANLQKDIPTGYAVTYYDSTVFKTDQTTTYGSQYNSYPIAGGKNDLIIISTLQTATWIGLTWLDYLSLSENTSSFNIDTTIATQLNVGWPFKLDMRDNTVPQTYIIRELTTLNEVETRMVGVGNAKY